MGETSVDISVVVPVYRSAACLPELVDALCTVLDGLGESYEIILVDDDSPDASWGAIEVAAASRPGVRGIQLMRNVGQISATLCGLSTARGEVVVTMDDDLQHPPDQLPVLLGALRADPQLDGVFGRFADKRHSLLSNLGSALVRAVHIHAHRLPREVYPSSFRVLRRGLVQAILRHPTRSPSLTALICACTRRVRSVDVRHDERFAGQSNYTLARQIRLAFDNICGSSTLPLKVVSMAGILLWLASFLYVLYVLWQYFMHRIGVPGWTTLTVLNAFFAGAILLSLGVFGEYMIRVLREVRGGPRHIERRRIGEDPDGAPEDGAP